MFNIFNKKEVKCHNSRSGFTMIELMLVIVIGVGLSAFVIPRFMDTKKLNEAREEAQKLSELKARIESMYDFETNFDKLKDIWKDLLPSTFELQGQNVKSIWKRPVTADGGPGYYTISYEKVPADGVCAEFIKNAKRQQWYSISIGGTEKTNPNEMGAAEIVPLCRGQGRANDVIPEIIFRFDVNN